MNRHPVYCSLFTAVILILNCLVTVAGGQTIQPEEILIPTNASALEYQGGHEVRRYIYLRTGTLLPVKKGEDVVPSCIYVGRKDRNAIQPVAPEAGSLTNGSFLLKTVAVNGGNAVILTGNDDVTTLYAAYRFAEHLGVRFYLDGDGVPDKIIHLEVPSLNERKTPLFALRGIQPFHDFPEGPDWWNREEYLAIIAQLPKLRMNFIGLHTYPEGRPNAEPTVWLGLPGDVETNGNVKFSYPSSYNNTLRGNWGYAIKNTEEYLFGASQLFERNDYGPDVMGRHIPSPMTLEGCNEVFNNTAALLREAFTLAHQLGVKTCVGTESPMVIPHALQVRLRADGRNADDPDVLEEIYEGTFLRAMRAYPLDYYWLWTPEWWTWRGASAAHVAAVTNDFMMAIKAHKKVNAPFALATCGWVLGPQQDRTLFDTFLPKNVTISCINREMGKTPIEKGFANVKGRSKWAISWLEDDPALTLPQLWAGRMRRDAQDARLYGCEGLMGLHWRTRAVGPMVSILSQAAWDQEGWKTASSIITAIPEGPVGGKKLALNGVLFAGADEPEVYQTIRYDFKNYNLKIPNGSYTVTLKYCEPIYRKAGQRVFDVELQGQTVLRDFDIYKQVGDDHVLDCVFTNIMVTNENLEITFDPQLEFPAIAGIVVQSPGFEKRINCGGPAVGKYEADLPSVKEPEAPCPSTDDFYRDWARNQFGEEAAEEIGAFFAQMDGKLPRPAEWVEGPGGIKSDRHYWKEVKKEYAFVDEFEALGRKVRGTGNKSRFDFWLLNFKYLRTVGELRCTCGRFDEAFFRAVREKDVEKRKKIAREQILPLRRDLVRETREIYSYLLAFVGNSGEMGTLMNWERIIPDLLVRPGILLEQLLEEPLASADNPSTKYHGPLRLIVPTTRTSVTFGEKMTLKAMVLTEKPVKQFNLFWRVLGEKDYNTIEFAHVARGVYKVQLPEAESDMEYFVKVENEGGEKSVFPVLAPKMNQTVVVCGQEDRYEKK